MFRRSPLLALVFLPAFLFAACQAASPPSDLPAESYSFLDDDTGQDLDTELATPTTEGGNYASKVSVLPGESIAFHVSNSRNGSYDLSIYREGSPRRLMATVPNVQAQNYSCAGRASTGCDWPVAATFAIPEDWPTGVYTAEVPRPNSGQYRTIFFVRERNPGTARILFLTSVNTFHAYNAYGGGSLYKTEVPRVNKVSFDRPYSGTGVGNYDRWESHFVDWAEAAGYQMAYATTYDLEFYPNLLKPYDVVIIAGHSEYWTWDMRQRLKTFIAEGGRFMNLSGNTMWWQVRFEDDGRTMVGYKNWRNDPDKSQQGSTTVNWNYPIFDSSFVITGMHWPYGGYPGSTGKGFYAVNAGHWIFTGTGLAENDYFGKGPTRHTSIHDKESDGLAFNCGEDGASILGPIIATGTPANFTILGVTSVHSQKRAMDSTAMMGLYTTPSGGAVFSAGTTGWVLGLDQPVVARITRNILDRFLAGNFPQEPAAADSDVLFRDRFNCSNLGDTRASLALPPEDPPKLNYVAVERGTANRLTAECGYRGPGLSLRPANGMRYVANLMPDWSRLATVYTGVYLNLHNLTMPDNATIDLFHGYDDDRIDDPSPMAVLQLGRRAGQFVVRYQRAGQNFNWVTVPGDRFFLLETLWDAEEGRASLSIDGQARALEALPGTAASINRVDFGTIDVAGNATGTLCLDELVYDDRSTGEPPPPPPPPATEDYYLSFAGGGTLGGVAYADEDILHFTSGDQTWSMYFDGSDVGLGAVDLDALALMADGSLLLSVDRGMASLAGVGTVADADVLRFVPASLGSNTAGQFSLYLDGSDLGLTGAGEDVDALALLPDGRLLLSTTGNFSVGQQPQPVKGRSQDLLALSLTQTGADSAGQWELYFDGSDVGLAASKENLDGVWAGDDAPSLSTKGAAVVPGLNFGPADLVRCAGTMGSETACNFSLRLPAATLGLTNENIDGVEVVP